MKEISKEQLEEIVGRLRTGGSLIEESHGLGCTHNGPLRAALKKLLGPEGYDGLMGGKRAGPTHVAVDDTDVPVITKAKIKDGWRADIITVRHRHDEVFTAPDGQRYVKAQEGEKADLIVDLTKKGLGRVRIRLEHGSRQVKAQKHEEKIVEHGEAQRKRRAGFEPADSLRKSKKGGKREAVAADV